MFMENGIRNYMKLSVLVTFESSKMSLYLLVIIIIIFRMHLVALEGQGGSPNPYIVNFFMCINYVLIKQI